MKELCEYGNLPDDEWELLPWIPNPRPLFRIWVKPEHIRKQQGLGVACQGRDPGV